MVKNEIMESLIDESIPEEIKPRVREALKKLFDKFTNDTYVILYRQGEEVKLLTTTTDEISISVKDETAVAKKIKDITEVYEILKNL